MDSRQNDYRNSDTHVRDSESVRPNERDERSAPQYSENYKVQKGMESSEPRLFRPDRVVHDERSEIPTETFIREGAQALVNQANSYSFDDRRDSPPDSLIDQEETRNQPDNVGFQEDAQIRIDNMRNKGKSQDSDKVFEAHYWEKPGKSEDVPMPKAMAEFTVESRHKEDIDSRPIISQVASTQPQRARPFRHSIMDIVLWRNIKDSAIIFSVGLVALAALASFSFIAVVAYASLAVLVLAGGFVVGRQIMFAVQKRSGPHPFRQYMEQDVVINPESVHQQVDNLLYPINRSLTRMRNLYLADSLAQTLKFMLFMYLLTYIGSWFNLMTLVIVGWVAAFTLPKVYLMYKRQIDSVLIKARGYVRMAWSTVSEKVSEQRDRLQHKRVENQGVIKEQKTTTITKVQKIE